MCFSSHGTLWAITGLRIFCRSMDFSFSDENYPSQDLCKFIEKIKSKLGCLWVNFKDTNSMCYSKILGIHDYYFCVCVCAYAHACHILFQDDTNFHLFLFSLSSRQLPLVRIILVLWDIYCLAAHHCLHGDLRPRQEDDGYEVWGKRFVQHQHTVDVAVDTCNIICSSIDSLWSS